MVNYIRTRWVAKFLQILDEEKIWPQQWLFYIMMILDGFYNMFAVSVPVQSIQDSLPGFTYTVFLIFCIGGPALSLFGKTLKGDWAFTGMLAQLTGDTAVWGVCTIYVAATFYTTWYGQGNFAGAFVMASAIGSFFFIIRGLRRIAQRDRWIPVTKK
jgi:hypothetical protein